jgi:hypothetical protein
MRYHEITDERLDRMHDANCAMIAQWVAALSDDYQRKLIAMGEKGDVHLANNVARQRIKRSTQRALSAGFQPDEIAASAHQCAICTHDALSPAVPYCHAHYLRQQRWGDARVVLRVKGGRGYWYYEHARAQYRHYVPTDAMVARARAEGMLREAPHRGRDT